MTASRVLFATVVLLGALAINAFLGEGEEEQTKERVVLDSKTEEQYRREEAQRKKEEERRKAKNRGERKSRLAKGQRMMLYHQTNEMAAVEIRKTGRMLRGTGGMAGGGIYFATSKTDTRGKAQQYGYMVYAWVKVGRVKTSSGDPNITFKSLLEEGYDSVRVPRTNGDEYVVYNYDQVEVIDVKKKKWRSKW